MLYCVGGWVEGLGFRAEALGVEALELEALGVWGLGAEVLGVEALVFIVSEATVGFGSSGFVFAVLV